ncbi:MAG: hypothetical protein KQ78_01780 [Candidatus Izimaplasma bacterium HR2]|nr:MAG: hypothetical protein KQ78_01780 [Candidatus Izimaplasma bacterium HR2]
MSKIVKASEIFKLAQAEFCIQNRKYLDDKRDSNNKCKYCYWESLCNTTIMQIKLIKDIENKKERN